ncbi:Leaf rust 10 disease-resistance locus receptor-like protein kinase [Melia azedarach]|uniref:Leaf rust 10 disease-resistance locus receptor-like protein kinase n=1 Tax=Melia azedarach TaxID=155640 RepID=A0ACC1XRR0_MELAZ|nr:Leaf rust 10 disease-resistance locus receptor-like protein kinase [Melia azedarach]
MSIRFFPSLVLYSVITMLCILIAIPSSYCDEDELYAACNRPYTCGQQIRDMWYPFWGNNIRPQYCGRQGFELKCNDNQNSTILFGDQSFQVLNINMLAQKMIIARNDLLDSLCSAGMLEETIINHNLFSYGPNVRNISLFFACSGELSSLGQNNFSCTTIRGDTISGFYIINGDSLLQNRSNSCKKVIKVPFLKTDDLPVNNTNDLLAGRVTEVLKRGFEVEYRADNASCSNCLSSLGICGSNQSSEQFVCLCRDQPHTRTCPSGNGSNLKLKLGIGNIPTSLF